MKRILTIQDISCLGQCSLTVALPIISALGVEASVLPTAVLSTHTMFKNFTFCDLTEEMPKIEKHWIDENLKFDGFYTGYVGSIKQIEYISSIMDSCGKDAAIKVVDPCMADHGKLYPGFSVDFPKEMLKLCKKADVIVPNLTEACLLLDIEYKEYDKEGLENIAKSLAEITNANVVLTGVSFEADKLGTLTYDIKENKIDVMIEDCVEAIIAQSPYTKKHLCYDTRYNRNFTHNKVERVFSWYDIYRNIKEME